jgi:predicted 3-demethylubiquinone-9 3-methyltransferase (glyoxalase superfamily)
MRHLLTGTELPQQINSIEEAIAILEKHNEDIAFHINAEDDNDVDDNWKAMIHYNTLIINYLETLLNKEDEHTNR